MDSFVVSARKYRPARFADVIGQSQVTLTLKNAIRQNQVAQAFLFCGPRGVGKTTCARILAKVLNCENPTAEIEACNECASCRSFNQNASFNIHELDAASNNSVEDIRALIDQVRFAPQQGKRKIYIIDEVHMLSSQAFNAFLKTLEEPPPYAVFILATTEKHKILPTILSRCQIFDFNRIKTEDTANYLSDIAEKENIETDQDALHLIAQKADGALRDALSMFDRLAVFGNNKITYQTAVENLNVLDFDYFFKITDSFLAKDISSILLTFDKIIKKGFEGENFIQGLAEHIRNLIVASNKDTIAILDISENLKQRYMAQAMYVPLTFLINALNLIHEADARYKQARNKRLLVELLLIKLCNLKEYIETLNQTEVKKKPDIPGIPVNKTTPPQNQEAISCNNISVSAGNKEVAPLRDSQPIKNNSPLTTTSPLSKTKSSLAEIQKSIQQKANNNLIVEAPEQLTEDDLLIIDSLQFKECINALLSKLESGMKVLHSAILAYPPQLVNNKHIEIKINNSSIHKLLLEEKDMILNHLRVYLKMDKISLKIIFDEEAVQRERNTKPFTPEQRFEHLKKQNPKLQDLQKKLKLNIS